jgi:hypothetical protein
VNHFCRELGKQSTDGAGVAGAGACTFVHTTFFDFLQAKKESLSKLARATWLLNHFDDLSQLTKELLMITCHKHGIVIILASNDDWCWLPTMGSLVMEEHLEGGRFAVYVYCNVVVRLYGSGSADLHAEPLLTCLA